MHLFVVNKLLNLYLIILQILKKLLI